MLTITQIATLKTEITTDPLSLGYSVPYAAGADAAVAALLNAVTGNGTASIFNNQIPLSSFVHALAAADFASLTLLQIAQLNLLFINGVLDATVATNVTLITALVSGMTTPSKTAVTAIAKRTGSRAESIFVAGVVVATEDVTATRH